MAKDYEDILGSIKVDKRKAKDISLSGSGFKKAYLASQNLPQAVLKISSYSHGKTKASAHLKYINRQGNLDVEDPGGNKITDPMELKELMDEWAMDFDKRKNSRDTVNIVLSAPKDSELGAVESSVRDFAQKTFGQTNDYLFAIHNDTDHPHGHLMVKMRGYDGSKLDPQKEDLRQWREQFAESLRDHGVMVDASPRLFRGVGRKGTKQNVHHIRERGETPKVDKEAMNEIVTENIKGKDPKNKPWAKAAKAKTLKNKKELSELAQTASELADASGNAELKKAADSINTFAENIKEPKTRAEEINHAINERNNKKDIDREV